MQAVTTDCIIPFPLSRAGRGTGVRQQQRSGRIAVRCRASMPINVPILLTWLRIVLIPVFVAIYYLPDAWMAPATRNWTAMWIFAVASITDWLDGWVARRWGRTTPFGAFLRSEERRVG